MNFNLGRPLSRVASMTLISFLLLVLANTANVHEVEDTVYEVAISSVDPDNPSHTAPDGFKVWELADINAGGIAQFQLPPQRIGGAIMHQTVSEIWFIVAGQGRVWIKGIGEKEIGPGTYFTVPAQTAFQVRNDSDIAMTVIGLTMPHFHPEEVVEVDGPWASEGAISN